MLELVVAEVPARRDELEHELLRIRGEIELRELYFSRLAAGLAAMDLAEDSESEMTTNRLDSPQLSPHTAGRV